jgi:hypothetical protein
MSIRAIPAAPAPQTQAPAAKSQSAAGQSDDGWDFSFKNLFDLINPLQHIPVIGTIYRNLTGDRPALPEKIAGDTLYGGLLGFVCSVADSAFTALTGKDFGDTVLAFFTGGGASANGQTAPALAASQAAAPNGDTHLRAALAYRKSIAMTDMLADKAAGAY